MQTAPALYSNASAQFKNDPQQTVTPLSRFSSNVTSATPAKRITFFKSGDPQFSGVRMAIHKRSFKCFDALLDDLSQKVPLPFGVRTITTPRGTHSIKQLEQLEDGGCYLCSDRRYVKPINIEAAGKRPAVWHHHSHTHNTRRRPSRPDEAPNGHHYHRHPKRIILVKNNDPAVRRSITLSRRTARSLRVFMDEISEIMQCHVRKLYTLEGRKIDSIQSLMQCPNVLVCVGKEPFRPLLMESLRKHSDEKLPGVGSRSRSSICSEGHDSKKNVNFGLETKKSIIHPRSDSSNRSTRFSLSSEKSYQNGLCMTPGQTGCLSTCPHTREIIRNDDIEKRVLVNKDGSLSVEMKVRFRLLNDETLQWSTEIKKSAGSLIDGSSVREGDAPYLQGKTEYSDPESTSPYEAEETLATKLHQRQLEESHCQNCCNHCQEYDIWKNPMHKDHGASKSSSSSASSHKVVQEKSSMDSVRTISRSSEEYTEHIVEKASCFQQTVKEGDTKVEYCSISRCCSRSEVCASSLKSKMKQSTEDKYTRPISVISNSSKVLELLKEDLDDYDDLPPSVSRASLWSQTKRKSGGDSDDGSNKSVKTCTSPAQELNDIEGQAKGPDSLSDSVTSHSLSAADLLRERIGNTRPVSRESKSYVSGKNSTTEQNDKMTFKSDKTSNCKNKKMRASSQNKNEDQFSELIPLALPNASPTEVVKDWLRKIPTDGPMYEMDDEFKENSHDVEPPINAENVTETVQKDSEGASEQVVNIEEPQEEENEESVGDVPKEDNNNAFDETETHTDQPDSDSMHLCRSPKISKREALSKFCHSSVQVMKVLLSPKLDRCNSLPEVSPVYGRKLSTSAKGLLDCLSNLRLIDSDPTNPKDDKYNEIMNILQSLWLCEPVEGMEDKGQKKDLHSAEDEFNPRSSSGVDVGSGSADSGKSSVNDGVEKMEIAQNRIAPIAEQEPPLQEQEEDEDNENKDNHSGASSKRAESSESSHIPSDPATPDIAERVKSSPENEKSDDGVPTSDEMTQSSENPKGETEIDASLSKSSGNDSNVLNTPPATEMTVPEDTNSETSPSVQRAPLTKRVSQDPDPVWVLGLLKKLENQFMTHYANAMAEFKVRWDLEDNEMLDTMIRELKEEVRKRIQTSINRELQKIRSRAGRPPKPPVNTLSRESTAQTELRRRRLKIMHNQSINPSLSRSNYTGSVTDFSDQRSDDEYCPCETCMKKKMASRTVQRAEALCSAPVLMDFDLRKILQMKKDPPLSVPVAPKLEEERSCPNQTRKEENVDLDMVHEEAQEENDEIKNCSSMLIEDHRDASRQDDEHFERKHDTDKGMFSENGTTETEKPTDKATAEKDGDGAEREIVKCENPMEEESAEEERAEDEETIVEKTQDRTEEASGESEAEDGNSEERESVEKEALQNTTKGKKRGGDEEIGDEEKTEEEGVLEGETGGEEEATEQGSINNAHAEGGEMAEGETAKEIGGEGERTTEVTHKEKTADGENVEDKGETEEYEEKEIKEDTVEDRETGKEGEEESDEGGVEVSKEGRANNTSDDRPADGDEMADTVENENPDMDETANEAEEEDTPNKNCVDQNRDTSAEGEDEDDDAGDDEMANTKTENEAVRVCLTETRETNGQEEDSTSSEVREVAKLRDYEEKDGEVAEVEDSETDERQKNDTDGENMDEVVKLGEGEVQETPEKKRANEEDKHTSSDEDAVEESKTENETLDNVLNKQITRTSIESQPGSLEYSKDLTVTAKLQEIHSFMESNESQGENVISTLSHSKEKRNESSRHGRKADKDSTSEVTELQVTSKGRKRLSGRANKQQRPNKGGIRVNDLEF
ncbi:retinitis pigmentosa 1-like 1 protein [Chanos chanos]|uniref:Retinitis pigmentosa 1-like 1 protein n=1 Tax=Chanos chanos TaxID=29144 RepID=A0A6J2VMP0_CHACN|nr:retinitis pigmentosa 1-like 1 protein [Chanos chanos]